MAKMPRKNMAGEYREWEQQMEQHFNAGRDVLVKRVQYRPHLKLFVEVSEKGRTQAPDLALRLAEMVAERFGQGRSPQTDPPKIVMTQDHEVVYRYPPRRRVDIPFPDYGE